MFILRSVSNLIACAVLVMLVASDSYSLPINSDLGITPHKGELILRAQTRYTFKGDDPTSQDREQDIYSVPLVAVYGFTSKASILFKIPIISKELRAINSPDRGDTGLGDTTVLGKYRVYTHNFKGGTSRLSLVGGLELPTGEDDERDSTGTLPAPLQLGSGALDIIAGGAYTLQTLDYELDADLRYKINREANQFNFGDEFIYNFSYQKRILPVTLPDKGVYSQWNALLELNGSVAGKNESLGVDVINSGGHSLFLSPGIQYVSTREVYEFSYQQPILQDLNGNQLETDYKLALSARVQF
jgi:hypothetical protein